MTLPRTTNRMTLPRTTKVPFGGDYNPEQWPEQVWQEDYRLFDAARIDTLTLGVLDWALTRPAGEVYDFSLLDRIVDRARAERRRICLATGTAAHPPWLARACPEVTRADWYAGTVSGSGNAFGAGHGWYVGAGLHQTGIDRVVRQILARHALYGPYPDVPELESALRVAPDGTRLTFLLNHRPEPVEVTAVASGVDLLTGDRIDAGRPLRLPERGVVLLREDR